MNRSISCACRIGVVMALLVTSAASVVMAEDVIVQGKAYLDVRVDRVEPDGIGITHAGGICKLDFADLPVPWQQRYGYDPDQAAAYREQLQRQREQQKRGPALSREEEVKRTLEARKLRVDLEILEMKKDGAEATGTCLAAKTTQRRETNEQGRTWQMVETRMVNQRLGVLFVLGLASPLVKGGRWSGTLYPLGRKRDGYPMYAASHADAVSLLLTGELPKGPSMHPFLRGLGDGLAWPFRYVGYSGLTFAPPEEREFRYWCGVIIGGCAYLIVLIPFLRRQK